MRLLVSLLGLMAISVAGEPDGAVAPAARWSGPRGPASGSFASRATPVVSDVREAWHIDFAAIHTPPVHWDGRGYIVAREENKDALVAFDLRTGAILARKLLPGVPRAIFVWDDTVYCQVIEGQLDGYRLRRKAFVSTWKYRGRRDDDAARSPHHPVIHDNEVYCPSGYHIVRLRPPSPWPVWAERARGAAVGRPAVYGNTAFVLLQGADCLLLQQFDRSRGASSVSRIEVTCRGGSVEPQITIASDMIYVRLPRFIRKLVRRGKYARFNYALIPCAWSSNGRVSLEGRPDLLHLAVPPVHTSHGTLCLVVTRTGREWRLRAADGRYEVLAREKMQPYLFRDLVAPTILGDIAYCGSWAVDLETREILWRLPVSKVSFPVVPADRMFLIVESGKTLRAFRGRMKE